MPIIKEDYRIVKRNRRDGRYNSTYEGRVSKDQLPLLGGRQDEKYAGKIERHQDSKRDLQKSSRVISQQGNEHSLPQNRQSTRQRTQPPQDSRTGSQQATDTAFHKTAEQAVNKKTSTASTREQNNRKVPPSARSGNQKRKAVPKPNQSV
jgi:hypothetical protein